jgi:hypothetical protein
MSSNRCAFPDAPRADRKGGGGVSTAFHSRPTTSPAVASGRRPRRGKCGLGAAPLSVGFSEPDQDCFQANPGLRL